MSKKQKKSFSEQMEAESLEALDREMDAMRGILKKMLESADLIEKIEAKRKKGEANNGDRDC